MAFDDLELPERLAITRRGTALFAQGLATLTDEQLDAPTLLTGWSRRHLVAHVGYNAAAICRLLDWAATGVETPMYPSAQHRAEEIGAGATLSPGVLRNLFDDTVARLDEKWRSLPDAAWGATVRTAQGRSVPATETVWMRAREVWIHAVDLDNGAGFADFPESVLDGLMADIAGGWRNADPTPGIVLLADGRAPVTLGSGGPTVAGPLPAVVRWMAGRGAAGLHADPGIAPPRWL
ncbi:MAG: maleylpyruvate isomerase family mycothiol-dependent enzyme [Actinobacteria bacterium]|nr:maleylpyruvate isomerase family mycothiol-dependent enzyme [Actinomycetota bacterium]